MKLMSIDKLSKSDQVPQMSSHPILGVGDGGTQRTPECSP